MKIYFLSKQHKTKEKYNVFSDHEEQYACIWVLLKSVLLIINKYLTSKSDNISSFPLDPVDKITIKEKYPYESSYASCHNHS